VAVAGLYRHPGRIVNPGSIAWNTLALSAYPFHVGAMLTDQDVADYLKQGVQR